MLGALSWTQTYGRFACLTDEYRRRRGEASRVGGVGLSRREELGKERERMRCHGDIRVGSIDRDRQALHESHPYLREYGLCIYNSTLTLPYYILLVPLCYTFSCHSSLHLQPNTPSSHRLCRPPRVYLSNQPVCLMSM